MKSTDICNFEDDTTQYTTDMKIESVTTLIENDARNIISWFADNQMIPNGGKCHLVTFRKIPENIGVTIGYESIVECKFETLLGVILDKKISFKIL